MSSASTIPMTVPARYSDAHSQKLTGATYTPEAFAAFVAEKMVAIADLPSHGRIRILDPAVGDGALLEALIACLPDSVKNRVDAYGFDINCDALEVASQRLVTSFPNTKFYFSERDFLTYVLDQDQICDLFQSPDLQEHFHLVIANPPYVRTQVMGGQMAQKLAKSFELTGRVDLYYPFLLGISKVLSSKGVMGVITSNRFMTTKSGQCVRRAMLSRFDILHVWDLGDTKLFDAAVLPSVILARGNTDKQIDLSKSIPFSTIYETQDRPQSRAANPLAALSFPDEAVVATPDLKCFRIRHGILDNGGESGGVWRIGTLVSDQWLTCVAANTWDTFRRIGKIRVGVKSTADKVFIRNDWDQMPGGRVELLRPLITRHCARRYKSDTPIKSKHIKEILYPHEIVNGCRAVVDLNKYPKSAAYLEQHRSVLASRQYVIDAGRSWYELWVPQDPAAWTMPKLVFPDISDKPIFWLDSSGGVVSGECYWLKTERVGDEDLLWLALAIANSSFIEKFYDHRFNNKLYAGRRRFITQYVELFPLPDPAREDTQKIIALVKKVHANIPFEESSHMTIELDKLVWEVFGLTSKEIGR